MVRKLRIIEVRAASLRILEVYVPYKSLICKGKMSDFNLFAKCRVNPREIEIVRLEEVFELSRFELELARFNCILKKKVASKFVHS